MTGQPVRATLKCVSSSHRSPNINTASSTGPFLLLHQSGGYFSAQNLLGNIRPSPPSRFRSRRVRWQACPYHLGCGWHVKPKVQFIYIYI